MNSNCGIITAKHLVILMMIRLELCINAIQTESYNFQCVPIYQSDFLPSTRGHTYKSHIYL